MCFLAVANTTLFIYRVDKEKAPFLSGLQGMGAAKEITVTVMATLTVSTPFPSAVLRSKVVLPGMQRSALQHWLQHTAVGIILTRKL